MLNNSMYPTKGYINTKPILTHALASNVLTSDSHYNEGSYEWQVDAINSSNDVNLPSNDDDAVSGNDHGGYLGTSVNSLEGLSHWSIWELPTQPLVSIGELQHFDLNFNNPEAPRVSNAIGNSHATYQMSSDSVGSGASLDHSYVSNHLFFDDWFISSITPRTSDYSSAEITSLEDVYENHLTGNNPLSNASYIPKVYLSATNAANKVSEDLNDNLSWRNIASELKVKGMFNINSTSIPAWTALLKHQRDAQVPEITHSDGSWDISAISSSGHPVSRTSIASDPNASSSGTEESARHVIMTDAQIEALAEEIVSEVKLRGPFLSLSEFANRQLTSDVSLALAGTIESALISLSTMGAAENPFASIQSVFDETAQAPPTAAFPEAAVGNTAYGTPGWIRQADILKSIAPIITARDDTFTIRTYGSSTDPVTGEVIAEAWCEALIQRDSEYVDSIDESTEYLDLQSETNMKLGRKFKLVNFRWLSKDEI